MANGVVAIFADLNVATLNSIRSFVNNYNIPFFTWTYPSYNPKEIELFDMQYKESDSGYETLDNLKNYSTNPTNTNIKIEKYSKESKYNKRNYILNTHPTISPLLIKLIKNYRWKTVYYFYNHEEGII